jgi:hypothetical protein
MTRAEVKVQFSGDVKYDHIACRGTGLATCTHIDTGRDEDGVCLACEHFVVEICAHCDIKPNRKGRCVKCEYVGIPVTSSCECAWW